MKNTKRCPKCSSQNIVRVPDNQKPSCQREQYLYFDLYIDEKNPGYTLCLL